MVAKKRNYKQEYVTQKARGEHPARMERQKARREFDKKHTGTMTKVASARKGKDLSHNKSLAKGGTNADGYKVESRSKNRSRNGHSKGKG